ncbi:MAG TPA: phytanoyl-CoA dioxygenase family protein [Candidatus Binataceae bacterium]|nr:phytanoyl-CoA dioxygenase family protein [Candidatus Binataceae bacterium]
MIEAGRFTDPDYWRSFAPSLTLGDGAVLRDLASIDLPAERPAEIAALIKREGYIHQTNTDWGVDTKAMATAVRALSAEDISPVFGFLFDEFWAPFARLNALYESLLGKYAMLPDFWVWNVDPAKDDAGWKPHRDRGHASLLPGGAPKALTTWIPLTESTPLNGCIYIVPADRDPTYGTYNDARMQFELPAIRALPAAPGDFFIWNQAVMHWGSRTSPRAAESRISMAFELQRLDVAPFKQPLIAPRAALPFSERLRLVSRQMLQYTHMYKIDPVLERLAVELLTN